MGHTTAREPESDSCHTAQITTTRHNIDVLLLELLINPKIQQKILNNDPIYTFAGYW